MEPEQVQAYVELRDYMNAWLIFLICIALQQKSPRSATSRHRRWQKTPEY
jgi:hypothetical protein